ncbi:hypothetical protein EDB86DRAFT_2975433, partial [Lactarius hatsudake]
MLSLNSMTSETATKRLYATRRCIRLKLLHENSDDEDFDDEIDVPLSPNGDLDLHCVKLWWGIRTCQFTTSPTAAKTTCSSSVRPPHLSSHSLTYFTLQSSQKRRTKTSSKSFAHGPTSSSGSGAPSRTTPRGTSTASSRSAPSRGSCHSSPARLTYSLPPRSPSWPSCAGRVDSSWPCLSTHARARSEPIFPHILTPQHIPSTLLHCQTNRTLFEGPGAQ